MLRIFASVAFCLTAHISHAQLLPLTMEITTNKYVFPGQEFEMYMLYRDTQGELVADFSINHEKLNHTIIVSKDLETFAHVHPDQQKNGEFMVPINAYQGLNPDNLDASYAISKPGTYYVFSEVVPSATDVVTLVRGSLVAHGKENSAPLFLDTFYKNVATKYFKSTGEVGQYADVYRVTLEVQKMTGMVHFKFRIEEWHGEMGHYMTVTNLENWLGMPGHGILISEAGNDVHKKEFRHLHAMAGVPQSGGGHQHSGNGDHDHHPATPDLVIAGDNLEMMLSGQDVPAAGTYKLWAQFKHKGKVVTFPFVLSL